MYHTLQFIHEHLSDKLSCADIAKQCGYSVWYFCNLFHHFTGRSFTGYVRYYRMQYALNDILKGDHITDVAMRYGYDTITGFNKAFVLEFGCSPREIKTKNKELYLQNQRSRLKMNQLSDRFVLLREEAMTLRTYNDIIEPQYAIWSDVAARETSTRMDFTARRISLLAEQFPIVIGAYELIVGNNFGVYVCPEIPIDSPAFLKKSGLTDKQCEYVLSSIKKPCTNNEPDVEVEYTQTEKWLNDEWAAIGRCMDSNHSVVDYEQVIKLGFSGLLKKVERLKSEHEENAALYDAAAEVCRAGCVIGSRYANAARKMAEDKALAQDRRNELLEIARVCDKVPKYPAETLHEAIQSLWFAHMINTWEDTINANSLGRLDKILYPYYQADINSGRISDSDAFDLICYLWIKLYRDYDVQQSCIGGTNIDGSSAVNRLSWLMLDATEQLDFIRCLSVRFSKSTEKSFVRRAIEVVGHCGKGVPFFFNDDVMIPALISGGISTEDAYDYTQIGCVETVIPGKSNPHAVTGETNLLKALEYTLLNGDSMVDSSKHPGMKTGDISELHSFDKLKKAVYEQIDNILDVTCRKVADHTNASVINSPKPCKSLMTQGCLESGRDFNNHGAVYDYYQIMLGGIPNLADSLVVLKKFVYDEKKYSLQQVTDALIHDFPDERMRSEFVNKAPKYGNDIDEVDLIACDITNHACDVLEELSEKYKLRFHAQPFTFLWMIDHGKTTGASPDGRRKGEPIAYSVSPMQGRDFSGLIALLNSISKLPTKRTPGTTSAIVEVDPKLFYAYSLDRFTDILLTAASRGLSNVQFNTVSLETLQDAKIHPENHNNLAVRVSGFSQKFNLLDNELQDHIIERTKHQCL